jgi:protein-L-isoaspartate(D-aspartate) O-methyltransferase
MRKLGQTDFHLPRKQMVERQLIARGIKDPLVLQAMSKVPRHIFVDEALAFRAYGDCPLPIGEQQTISQPYIVAQMTEALELKGHERVLEIGTGSAYQAAILAEICYRVYTVERLRPLMIKARQLLEQQEYRNIIVRLSDGTWGWPEQAPFEAIIVTAGSPEIPSPLIEQLRPGGRMVVPVGKTKQSQDLIKITKDATGRVTRFNLGECRFVDLVGQYGWNPTDGGRG